MATINKVLFPDSSGEHMQAADLPMEGRQMAFIPSPLVEPKVAHQLELPAVAGSGPRQIVRSLVSLGCQLHRYFRPQLLAFFSSAQFSRPHSPSPHPPPSPHPRQRRALRLPCLVVPGTRTTILSSACSCPSTRDVSSRPVVSCPTPTAAGTSSMSRWVDVGDHLRRPAGNTGCNLFLRLLSCERRTVRYRGRFDHARVCRFFARVVASLGRLLW